MTDFVTLLRVKAVESGGERWVEGWATTPQEDRVGDVVEPSGAKFTLPLPLLFQHKHDEPIGAVTHATISEKGIRMRARLSVGVARAEEIWTLVKDGVLTAVSIGFRVLEQKPLSNGGSRYTSWEWLECSVVSVPANPGALISVAKCMAVESKELESRQEPERIKYVVRDINAGIPTKGGIDANEILDKAKGLAKAWVREHEKYPTHKLATIAGLVAKLGQTMASKILGRVVDLEHRIAALESYQPVDAEGFEELAKCMERLDKMESDLSEMSERSISYRGYWREGFKAKRGDAVTENGSLWIAVCSTDEKPANHSADWRLAARKGRDAQ